MSVEIKIALNEGLYLKEPQDSKLGRKPGNGGYLADVLKNGNVKFYGINLDKLRTSPDLLSNFGSKQSSLYLNFNNLFG